MRRGGAGVGLTSPIEDASDGRDNVERPTVATFLNNDDMIWLRHVSADPDTIEMLHQIPGDTRLRLEIEGVRGDWARARDGKDGRPTFALRPVGKTADFWKTMKPRRSEHLEFKVVNPRDTYLSGLEAVLSEWNSAEDDQAFRDL